MCDYSLWGHESRQAKKGDLLVTSVLGGHTVGLVSPDKPNVAVCLLSGTRLQIRGSVPEQLAGQYHVSPGDYAVFGQSELSKSHRDGLVFDIHPAGPLILFQDILEGLQLEVISIPASKTPAEEPARARSLELETA